MIDGMPMLPWSTGSPWGRAKHEAFQRKLWTNRTNIESERERLDRRLRQRTVLQWRNATKAGTDLEIDMARIEYRANPTPWERNWEKIAHRAINYQQQQEAQHDAWRREKKAEAEAAVLARNGGVEVTPS